MKTADSRNEGYPPGMYVCYFKPFYTVKNPQYIPIQGGKAIAGFNLNIQGDDTGDNISAYNPIFSELTVVYWVWKNAPKTEYVGFCHYRRFFDFKRNPKFSQGYIRLPEEDIRMVENLPAPDYARLLSDCDIIIPKRIVLPHSLRKNYEVYHYREHYALLRNTLEKLYPDYLGSFDKVMNGTNKLPAYNILITRWDLFDRYCDFIFPLFFQIQKEIKLPADPTQQRVFGYMSERLLAVFIYHHKLKAKEYPLFLFNRNAKKKSLPVYIPGNWIKILNFHMKHLWERLVHIST
jgi:hypothetical protein